MILVTARIRLRSSFRGAARRRFTDLMISAKASPMVGHRLAEILPIPLADKQSYLEIDDPIERLDRLAAVAPLTNPPA